MGSIIFCFFCLPSQIALVLTAHACSFCAYAYNESLEHMVELELFRKGKGLFCSLYEREHEIFICDKLKLLPNAFAVSGRPTLKDVGPTRVFGTGRSANFMRDQLTSEPS